MATSLELAITAIRSGRKDEGRQLLNLLIQQNPNNELAWLWMSSVVNSDEQRARCLYHVLAINPNNELARRGLQLLGIVVSDSRPVKVPRDSQPIPIQRTQPEIPIPGPLPILTSPVLSQNGIGSLTTQNGTGPLTTPQVEPASAATPVSQSVPMAERRPFRLDPRTITQELPFVPLREPFAETSRLTNQPPNGGSVISTSIMPVDPQPLVPIAPPATGVLAASNGQPSQPLESTPNMVMPPVPEAPVAAPQAESIEVTVAPPQEIQPETEQTYIASPPVGDLQPPVDSNSGQSVPVVLNQQPFKPDTGSLPGNPMPVGAPVTTLTDTLPLPTMPAAPSQQFQAATPMQYPASQPQPPAYAGQMSLQETRPSQPIWTSHSNTTVGIPQPASNMQPSYLAPPIHSNATMGMPTQHLSPQPAVSGMPAMHSNPTMGMPYPTNGQAFQPSEPMPVMSASAPMGMTAYAAPAYPLPYQPNPVYHSSATMAMPTMTEAEARSRLMASQQMPVNLDALAILRAASATAELANYRSQANRNKTKARKNDKEDDNEEEVNLLAVIVFGSLSVTALGGLGMLILLWFTSV